MIDVKDKASAEAAIAALGGPEISVMTITVTEKGYCLTPSTGALDFDNPALRADLKAPFRHARSSVEHEKTVREFRQKQRREDPKVIADLKKRFGL